MFPRNLRQAVAEIWTAVASSRAGSTLDDDDRRALCDEHLIRPERTREVITTIAVPFGGKGGEFSLWQAGGGFKAVIWISTHLYPELGVKADIQELQRLLSSVRAVSEVQLRDRERMERWLKGKGWPLQNGKARAG